MKLRALWVGASPVASYRVHGALYAGCGRPPYRPVNVAHSVCLVIQMICSLEYIICGQGPAFRKAGRRPRPATPEQYIAA